MVGCSKTRICFLSNIQADQDVCDVRVRFHEDLAGALTDTTSVHLLDQLRRELASICLDPKAHDGVIVLLDAVTDLTTDVNVSRSMSKSFYWARRAIKDPGFRNVWNETMKGVNSVFDRADRARTTVNTLFDNLTRLFDDPNFDARFEPVATNIGHMVNMPKKFLYSTVSRIVPKSASAKHDGRISSKPSSSSSSNGLSVQ